MRAKTSQPTDAPREPRTLLQVQASPYKELADDMLAASASFCLVAVFLCATGFKYAELAGLDDLQVILSREQKQLFVVNNATLSFLTIASVVGALVISTVIFFVQLGIEDARRRHEARTSKARRLRCVESGREVELAAIERDWFHLLCARAGYLRTHAACSHPPKHSCPSDRTGPCVCASGPAQSLACVGHWARSDAHREAALARDAAHRADLSRRGCEH